MIAHGPMGACPLELGLVPVGLQALGLVLVGLQALGLVLVGLQALGLVAGAHWPRLRRRR